MFCDRKMIQEDNIFIGFIVTDVELDSLLENECHMPIQTHKFGWALLNKICEESKNTHVISSPPASSYPCNSSIRIVKSALSKYKRYSSFGFYNIFPLNFIQRFVQTYILLIGSNNKNIIVHGLYLPYLLATVCNSIFNSNRVYVVLTDPIRTRVRGRFSIMRSINNSLIKLILKNFNGAFALTDGLANKYFPNKPAMIFPGLFSGRVVVNNLHLKTTKDRKLTSFTYAGGLEKEYGVMLLIEAFILLYNYDSSLKIELNICGKGSLEKECHKYSELYDQIHFHGMLNQGNLSNLYANSHVLINPRPADTELCKFSFPSKIFDYLETGIPVLTTKLDSIPSELENCFFYIESDCPKVFSSKVIDLHLLNNMQLYQFGSDAKKNAEKYISSFKFIEFMNTGES
jgi:hypothetical protein